MAKIILRGRLLRWGHTTGIRLPTKEAARLAIPVGSEVRVTIEEEARLEPGDMMVVHAGATLREEHDRVLAQGRTSRARR